MKKIEKLNEGYSVEVDKIIKHEWNSELLKFDDATFYQTWDYGTIHWGEKHNKHLVLRKNNKVVAMVQIRTHKIEFLKRGIAYVTWGPLWKNRSEEKQNDHLENIIKALYNEYVIKNKLYLRVKPRLIEEENRSFYIKAYRDHNFKYTLDPTKTIAIDLRPDIDEIYNNFSRTTKQSLKRAKNQNLVIEEGSDQYFENRILKIASEMKRRKKYKGSDQRKILEVNNRLPLELKLKLIIAKQNNEDVAAIGFQNFGKIGFPIVGGTSDKALESKASYILWLEMISYYKSKEFLFFDLAGVSKEKNPGTYHFKRGLAGKIYIEKEYYIGQFDACKDIFSKLIFKCADYIKDRKRV